MVACKPLPLLPPGPPARGGARAPGGAGGLWWQRCRGGRSHLAEVREGNFSLSLLGTAVETL